MAKSQKVRLYIRVRIAERDRFVDPVWNRSGTLRQGYALVDGQPEHYPEAVYYLRFLRGSKRVWQTVGREADAVVSALRRTEHHLNSLALGLSVPLQAPNGISETQPEMGQGEAIEEVIARYAANLAIRFAAAYDHALNQILTEIALDLATQFTAPEALLPYWGRLAFLNVMIGLPLDHISRFGLDRVVCTLVKRAKLNATTFALENGPVIGMDYALEPILKHFNRYLLHYYSTNEMARPNRLSRAWSGIAPTVLHFWSDVTVTELTRSSTILFDDGVAAIANYLTNDQVAFIVMHELGHVALNHPKQLQGERKTGCDINTLRHEFEFAADEIALGFMRSKLVKEVRAKSATPKAEEADNSLVEEITVALHKYQQGLGAVYILFVFMDFIQRAGELLRDRLGGNINIRSRMDTHPRARTRLERLELMNMGEHLYTSPIERYAQDFLQAVLDYASALDDEGLLASLKASF